MDITG